MAQARGDAGLSEPLFFDSPDALYEWLEQNHDSEDEVYVGYWKKHTGKPSLSWSEAVDQALCFGWIDGRLNRIDDERHMQRFTPRRKGSNWSNVNVKKVARLEAEGKMRPAGRAAFEARDPEKTGVYSFESEAQLPLDRFPPEARAFWEDQPPGYRRTASHWVQSAKREETRERRLATLIEDCSKSRRLKVLA